ncbi:hypothetical protein [Ferruginibacter sp. SUN106]|uniref:hypothetical protein n=1 Tax=Ferruginibacter sp. SUN106 TaxID=2978348 RepID=UPI003D35CAF1
MRIRNLLFLLPLLFLFSACEKTKDFDVNQLYGTWNIKKIVPLNGNTNTSGLDFVYGKFTFNTADNFQFINYTREVFTGTWLLQQEQVEVNCTTATDGTRSCNHDWNVSIRLDATGQVAGQPGKNAYFEYLSFTDADHFTGKLTSSGNIATHEYTFERIK